MNSGLILARIATAGSIVAHLDKAGDGITIIRFVGARAFHEPFLRSIAGYCRQAEFDSHFQKCLAS
jgi:hypothetical protein